MKTDILLCLSKELSHLLLGQPHGVVIKPYFYLSFIILGLVNDYFFHRLEFAELKRVTSNLMN